MQNYEYKFNLGNWERFRKIALRTAILLTNLNLWKYCTRKHFLNLLLTRTDVFCKNTLFSCDEATSHQVSNSSFNLFTSFSFVRIFINKINNSCYSRIHKKICHNYFFLFLQLVLIISDFFCIYLFIPLIICLYI